MAGVVVVAAVDGDATEVAGDIEATEVVGDDDDLEDDEHAPRTSTQATIAMRVFTRGA